MLHDANVFVLFVFFCCFSYANWKLISLEYRKGNAVQILPTNTIFLERLDKT